MARSPRLCVLDAIRKGKMTKECQRCKENKGVERFYGNSSKNDGLSVWCISCSREYARQNKAPAYLRKIHNKRYSQKTESKAKRNIKAKTDRIDPVVRLKSSVRTSVSSAVRNKQKKSRTFEAIGYTVGDLLKHLEERFTKGMNWYNYGKWHIDHIIPQDFFEFESTNDVEFKMCWRLENLQPLWSGDNIKKGNKIMYAPTGTKLT